MWRVEPIVRWGSATSRSQIAPAKRETRKGNPAGTTRPPLQLVWYDDRIAGKNRSPHPAGGPYLRRLGIYSAIGIVILLSAGVLGNRVLTYAPPKPLPIREGGVLETSRPIWNLPPEEPLPDNGDGVFRFNRSKTISKLRIVPRSEQGHIVVKVENWNDSQLVCWFLIRKGQSAETPISPGTYRLKFACGRRWYGEKHLFGRGPDASYSAIANEISIPANSHYTIELTPNVTGTLREKNLGSEDF